MLLEFVASIERIQISYPTYEYVCTITISRPLHRGLRIIIFFSPLFFLEHELRNNRRSKISVKLV